jgi:hypothetical protein
MRGGLIWGLLVAALGVILLLWNFDVFAGISAQVPVILTGAVAFMGLAFLFGFVARRQEWWQAIPGFLLLSVAVIIYLSGRGVAEIWAGVVLFLGLALAFGAIFFSNRRSNWWALIPSGTLTVVALLLWLSSRNVSTPLLGAVMFGGMGLVFGLLYLLAAGRRQFLWALIPAAVLGVMGLVTLFSGIGQRSPGLAPWLRLWPLLLVGAGLGIAGVALSRSRQAQAPVQDLPPTPAVPEASTAPGAGVHAVPQTVPARREDDPGTAVATRPATDTGVDQEMAPAGYAESGEVPDIYEFLKNAPPEGGMSK